MTLVAVRKQSKPAWQAKRPTQAERQFGRAYLEACHGLSQSMDWPQFIQAVQHGTPEAALGAFDWSGLLDEAGTLQGHLRWAFAIGGQAGAKDISRLRLRKSFGDPGSTQSRDERGQFTAGTTGAEPGETWQSSGSGTGADAQHPFATTDVNAASEALAAGLYVDLYQSNGPSTLLEELQRDIVAAKDSGSTLNLDLCHVSIEGENLFCAGNLGIPRVNMPQLSGTPAPGSPASLLPANKWGEVDLSGAFAEHLANDMGVTVTTDTVPANWLRPSQGELDGTKVLSISNAVADGTFTRTSPVYVTTDNYIIDGHHGWAGTVAAEYRGGPPMDIPVVKVDMKITDALREAVSWTHAQGIGSASVFTPAVEGITIRKALPATATFTFDLTNPTVKQYVQTKTGALITAISEQARQGVRQVINTSYFEGLDPYTTGKIIQPIVGLTGRWAQAVANYGVGLSSAGTEPALLDKMVSAYSERLLQARGELVARTEILAAENAGRAASWDQAQASGFIDSSYQKSWVVTQDERLCPICDELDGEQVGVDEPFSTGDDMPPAHPDCRCTAVLGPGDQPSADAGLTDTATAELGPEAADLLSQGESLTAVEPSAAAGFEDNGVAADQWGHLNFGGWASDLPPDEAQAITSYAEDPIPNDYLREGTSLTETGSDTANQVALLDAALEKSRVGEEVTAYRALAQNFIADLTPGDVFTDPGYVSTTLDRSVADAVSSMYMDQREWLDLPATGEYVVKVEIPVGTKGAYIDDVAHHGMKELLLARGLKYRVIDATTIRVVV